MTEATGWPPVTPETPAPIPAPAPDPAPETPAPEATLPAEPDPAPEAPPEPEPEPAPAEAAPFIPAEGVAGWLRDVLLDFHRRLSNAGH